MKKIALAALAAGLGWSAADEPAAVFTREQAEAGKAAYESACIGCHGATLIPAPGAAYQGQAIPPLAGAAFLSRWEAQTTRDLAERIQVAIGGFRPKGADASTRFTLTAYILQVNGARPGSQPLTGDTAIPVDKTLPAKNARR